MARRGENRVPPYDERAEVALLGNLLLRPGNMDEISRVITPADFYKPSHGIIFNAISGLWHSGAKAIDAVTLADALKRDGMLDAIGGPATLVTLMTNAPSSGVSSASKYADIILKMATYRSAIKAGLELVEAAYQMTSDPSDLVDWAKVELEAIGTHLGELPPDVWVLDEYLARPISERPQWCIEGIIREGWRVMVVAGEGVGKTVLFRQMAIAAAQGIHPLNFGTIPPCRSLIIDLENPDDSVMDVCTPINERVKNRVKGDFDPDRAWLWHRPAGINLRRRPDRIALETIIANVQPKLVCLGPLYKAYEVSANENDELAAREIMAVLDDLRTRYSFGLMMEHHAPKESGGGKRKLMPYGSSLWLRWPEIGLNLHPTDETNHELVIGRWRGDRLDNEWPRKLVRGQTWPWGGVWEDGHFQGKTDSNVVARPAPIAEPVSQTSVLPPRTPPSNVDADGVIYDSEGNTYGHIDEEPF